MRQIHFLTLIFFTSISLITITATAQVKPSDEELNFPEAKSESNPLTDTIKRRLKNVEYKPKRPECLSGPTNQPFPKQAEEIYSKGRISVFALPDTYNCDANIDDMIICDINDSSLFFIRAGTTDIKMRLIGSGQLKVRFGGSSIYECR